MLTGAASPGSGPAMRPRPPDPGKMPSMATKEGSARVPSAMTASRSATPIGAGAPPVRTD